MILIAVEKKESRGKKREREIRLPVWICAAFNAVQSWGLQVDFPKSSLHLKHQRMSYDISFFFIYDSYLL